MTYVLWAWGATFTASAIYIAITLKRGRTLSSRVDAENQRWLNSTLNRLNSTENHNTEK